MLSRQFMRPNSSNPSRQLNCASSFNKYRANLDQTKNFNEETSVKELYNRDKKSEERLDRSARSIKQNRGRVSAQPTQSRKQREQNDKRFMINVKGLHQNVDDFLPPKPQTRQLNKRTGKLLEHSYNGNLFHKRSKKQL